MVKVNKLKISYQYDTNYCVISPTDAYGGITPKGKLIVNFFTDIHKIPNSQIHDIDEKGIIKKDVLQTFFDDSKEKAKSDMINVDRIIHNTAIFSPEHAIDIAFWMIDNIIKSPAIKIEKDKLKEQFLKMLGEKNE